MNLPEYGTAGIAENVPKKIKLLSIFFVKMKDRMKDGKIQKEKRCLSFSFDSDPNAHLYKIV